MATSAWGSVARRSRNVSVFLEGGDARTQGTANRHVIFHPFVLFYCPRNEGLFVSSSLHFIFSTLFSISNQLLPKERNLIIDSEAIELNNIACIVDRIAANTLPGEPNDGLHNMMKKYVSRLERDFEEGTFNYEQMARAALTIMFVLVNEGRPHGRPTPVERAAYVFLAYNAISIELEEGAKST